MTASNAAQSARRPKSDVFTWEPPVSSSFMTRKLNLHTDQARRAFEKTFIDGQRALSLLASFLPFVTTPENFAAVQALIAKEFDELDKELRDSQERFEHLWNGACTGPWEFASYSKPLEGEIRCFTPEAKRLIDLYHAYDDLIMRLDALRWAGVIKISDSVQLNNHLKRRVLGAPNRLTALWIRARNSIKRSEKTTAAAKNGIPVPADLQKHLDETDAAMIEIAAANVQAIEELDLPNAVAA
jgi:hypothetical protein